MPSKDQVYEYVRNGVIGGLVGFAGVSLIVRTRNWRTVMRSLEDRIISLEQYQTLNTARTINIEKHLSQLQTREKDAFETMRIQKLELAEAYKTMESQKYQITGISTSVDKLSKAMKIKKDYIPSPELRTKMIMSNLGFPELEDQKPHICEVGTKKTE